MSLTMLTPPSDLKLKATRVEIIADTVINRGGRGVAVWKGSILDITGEDASALFAGNKARKSTAETRIFTEGEYDKLNTPKGK